MKHFLISCNTYASERQGLFHKLKETYAARYDTLSDDANKVLQTIEMDMNSKFVDKCAAQIHSTYTGWTNVNLLYFPHITEIASLEGLTL